MDEYQDPYYEFAQAAEKHPWLHHFTSIDSFEKIISTGTLLINSLENVEDKSEDASLLEFWRSKVFVVCFTHSNKGKKRFWNEYAKGNGVRISFKNDLLTPENYKIISNSSNKSHTFKKRNLGNPSHTSYSSSEDWCYYDISKIDIKYIEPTEFEFWKERTNGFIKNCIARDGVFQRYNWEEETRIRVTFDPIGFECTANENHELVYPKPPFKSAFLKLNQPILETLYISVSPNASGPFINEVRRILCSNPFTGKRPILWLAENGECTPTSR